MFSEIQTLSSIQLPRLHSLDLNGRIEMKLTRKMDDEEFFAFCGANPDFQIEQDKNGKLLIMSPVGFDSGNFEDEIQGELRNWRLQTGGGKTPSASTGFRLPDGSTYSADASWISQGKVNALTADQRKKFARIVPDFVVEIRSNTDRLANLKNKMSRVWIKNGVRLAWLIDPIKEIVYIYRSDESTEIVKGFTNVLSGEDVCKGFKFDLGLLLS